MSNFLERYKKTLSGRVKYSINSNSASKSSSVKTILNQMLPNSTRSTSLGPLTSQKDSIQKKKSIDGEITFGTDGSFSPKAEMLLNEMIDFCRERIDFMDPSKAAHRNKKVDYLIQILSVTSNPMFFRVIRTELRDNLFNMLRENVIRVIHPIPLTVIYSEDRGPIPTPNWPHLSIVHKILASYVVNSEQGYISSLITKEFLADFVCLLESPDSHEISAVENFIFIIFDSVNNCRQTIFNLIIKELMKYRSNNYLYPCVSPSLRFLVRFFKIHPEPIRDRYYDIYKTLLLPLFSSQMLAEFFSNLNDVAVFFEERDQNIATWTLCYLFNHWPLTDSVKERLYIAHISFLLRYIPQKDVLTCGFRLFRRINNTIVRGNFTVVTAALNLLQHQNFAFAFSTYYGLLFPIIISSLASLCNHWNENVKKNASDLVRFIVTMCPSVADQASIAKFSENMKSKTEQRMRNWEIVADFPSKQDRDSISCDFYKKLSDVFGTK